MTGTASNPSGPGRRRSRRHRRALWGLCIMAVALVVSGAGIGTITYSRQQSVLSRAQADRAGARLTLDTALAHAVTDGLSATRLRTVTGAEKAILDQPVRPARFRYFDGGEAGHISAEAAALRALVGEVDHIEAAATDVSRLQAASMLDELDAAVSRGAAAGLDVAADLSLASTARASVGHAPSPAAVGAALAGLTDRSTAIQEQTDAKLAADRAAAALARSREAAVSALSRGDRLVQQAIAYPQLEVQSDAATLITEHGAFTAGKTEADFDGVTGAATDAADHIAAVLAARSGGYAAMAAARAAIQAAINDKVDPGTVPAQLDALQAQLDAGATSATFNAVGAAITALVAPVLDRIGVAELGVGKVITINLSRQLLTAYQDGAVQLTTPITSGRPALPTPPGTYTVIRKNHPWTMVSDWPPSSPYWYPPSVVQYTLWFRNDGYAIHDAPWRATYGPGTEAQGSHGCVNVPMPIMTTLFNWADTGTRVVVT